MHRAGSWADMPTWDPYLPIISEDWGQHGQRWVGGRLSIIISDPDFAVYLCKGPPTVMPPLDRDSLEQCLETEHAEVDPCHGASRIRR
jgi:hypothetical protein